MDALSGNLPIGFYIIVVNCINILDYTHTYKEIYEKQTKISKYLF